MLPPDVGIATVRRLLTTGPAGEAVVAGRLGILGDERDATGGVDPARFETGLSGPMVGRVVSMGVYGGLVVETELDPSQQPFLYDHQIDGTAVLPGVMGIEAFAEVARLPLPGWHVVEVDDVRFLAPFKFYKGQPRTVTITSTYRREGAGLVAECSLIGVRKLATEPEPQVTTHFTGRVRLARSPVSAATGTAPTPPADKGASAEDVYAVYFHGPAYQVLERAWKASDGPVGLLAADLPPDHVPAGRPEEVEPRLIELVFQTAGTWEIGREDRFGLPLGVDRVVLHEALASPQGRVSAVVKPGTEGFDGRVMDEAGRVLVEVLGYRTVELPGGVDAERRMPLAEAMA
jgi:hypothetical protein